MHVPLMCAATLAGIVWSSLARADNVSGLRSEQLVERKHAISLKMQRSHAELTVRRTVHNGGARHDQATFDIDLPPGAVATGLRTLGVLRARPHWFAGELMEAEAAAAKYHELTGIGGAYPKDPALLSWRSQELLKLQVFPCPPAQDKTVEYTLKLPTRYAGGRYRIELPPLGTTELPAELTVRATDPADELFVAGEPLKHPRIDANRWTDPLVIELLPHARPLLDGELVAVSLAKERVLTRYGLQAAAKLSEIPRGAHVVLAVDTSLSTDSNFIDSAKTALDAYLSHFEGSGAKVEILTFDRQVERLFGRFADVSEARLRLSSLQVKRRNGSDVDTALSHADRLLTSAPASAERRIVLVTDGLTRAELTPERLRAALARSGAVTHAGLLRPGTPSLQRSDEHPWARAMRASAGLVWSATAPSTASSEDSVRVFEEWARPVRLDRLTVYSPELALQEELEHLPETLAEGEGIAELGIRAAVAPWIAVEGELWTTPIRGTFATDARKEALWSALVFGTDVLSDLSEEEMMTLALRGGAVSPVTSYLAIEPGVRPSTEGLEEAGGGSGWGIGLGGLGHAAMSTSKDVPSLDRDGFLRDHLSKEWRRCGGRPGSARVGFQTTRAEIVAIDHLAIDADRTPLLEQCLTNAVWDLILPLQFDEEWLTWSVSV